MSIRYIPLTLLLMFFVASPIGIARAADDVGSADEVMQKCPMKHPEWYQCVNDEDCTVSLNPCGWPVLGVNKMHKDRSEICTRQAGAFIDCPMWNNTPENKMVAFCKQGTCETVKASEAPVKQSKAPE